MKATRTLVTQPKFILSDAKVAVDWLNAAKQAKAIASYERVESIRRQFDKLRALRIRLENPYYRARARAAAAQLGTIVRIRALSTKSKLARRVARAESFLNEMLARYVWRPRVSYSIAYGYWRGAMAPDRNSRQFEMDKDPRQFETQEFGWTEADAVLALVRLDLIGEIHKVRLCEQCEDRWLVASKSHYRFCDGPAKCREVFHARRPDYHKRKADAQRRYRRRQKLREMMALAK